MRVSYKLSVMVYRCLHGHAPRYLADHLITSSNVASRLRLRSANRHQLIVPRCRLNTYGRQAFSIAGPTVWNSLSDELRDPACGSDSFKHVLTGLPANLIRRLQSVQNAAARLIFGIRRSTHHGCARQSPLASCSRAHSL